MGIVHDGKAAANELLSGVFKGFPDFTVEIVKTHYSDEIRMKGTHQGEWAGIKPTGKTMNMPATCIFDFEKVYFDMGYLGKTVKLSNFKQK